MRVEHVFQSKSKYTLHQLLLGHSNVWLSCTSLKIQTLSSLFSVKIVSIINGDLS